MGAREGGRKGGRKEGREEKEEGRREKEREKKFKHNHMHSTPYLASKKLIYYGLHTKLLHELASEGGEGGNSLTPTQVLYFLSY